MSARICDGRSAKASSVRLSTGVDRRRTDSPGRAWAISRAASWPADQPGSAQPCMLSTSGRGVARRIASVRMPSRPSEPRTSCRRSGPAADAGNGAMSRVPAGASRLPPANRLSMRPTPKLRSPDPRAATQPPTVASSHDCGS